MSCCLSLNYKISMLAVPGSTSAAEKPFERFMLNASQADRIVCRRSSDQLSPTSGFESDNNSYQFSVKDDDVIAKMSCMNGGSTSQGISQSNLYRSKPYQDITTLDVMDTLCHQNMENNQDETGSRPRAVPSGNVLNLNNLNIHLARPDNMTSFDRKATLDLDNARLRQTFDDPAKSLNANCQSTAAEERASRSGRRSAIPVLGKIFISKSLQGSVTAAHERVLLFAYWLFSVLK